MRIKLGDISQLYNNAHVAEGTSTLFKAISALSATGIQAVYTGVKGPGVWYEVPEDKVDLVKSIVSSTPFMGPLEVVDGLVPYLDIPFEVSINQRRRR